MNTFGKKSIGALALAVASITALAACSSSSSSSSVAARPIRAPAASACTGEFGSVPAMATGTETRRHDHGGRAAELGPDLDPADRHGRRQLGVHGADVRLSDVPAAVLAGQRRGAEGNAGHVAGQRPDLVQRRQDGHVHAQVQLQVVRRAADHLQGRAVLVVRDEGGDQGEPRQLGVLHPGPRHPRPGREHQRAGRDHGHDEPHQGGEPDLVLAGRDRRASSRCRPTRGTSTRPAAPITDWATNPADAKKIYRLPVGAVQVAVHLRDQPALAGRRRPVQADRLRPRPAAASRWRRTHLRRPARDHGVGLPGRCPSPPTRPSSTRSRRAASTSATCR